MKIHRRTQRLLKEKQKEQQREQRRKESFKTISSTLKFFLIIVVIGCAFAGGYYGSVWSTVQDELSNTAIERYYGTELHSLDFMSQNIPDEFIASKELEERMKEVLGRSYSRFDDDRFMKFAIMLTLKEMNSVLPDDLKSWIVYNKVYAEGNYKWDVSSDTKEVSNDEYKPHSTIDNAYYVKFNTFSKYEALMQFENHIEEMNQYDTLILDLRLNSGGLVSVVREMSDLFLDRGEVMFKIHALGEAESYIAANDKKVMCKNIVVLQSDETASAAEALISALSDLNIVKIGGQTFGKGCGSLAEPHDIYKSGEIEGVDIASEFTVKTAYNSLVEMTSANFLSLYWTDRHDKSVLNNGIAPDYEIDPFSNGEQLNEMIITAINEQFNEDNSEN